MAWLDNKINLSNWKLEYKIFAGKFCDPNFAFWFICVFRWEYNGKSITARLDIVCITTSNLQICGNYHHTVNYVNHKPTINWWKINGILIDNSNTDIYSLVVCRRLNQRNTVVWDLNFKIFRCNSYTHSPRFKQWEWNNRDNFEL